MKKRNIAFELEIIIKKYFLYIFYFISVNVFLSNKNFVFMVLVQNNHPAAYLYMILAII